MISEELQRNIQAKYNSIVKDVQNQKDILVDKYQQYLQPYDQTHNDIIKTTNNYAVDRNRPVRIIARFNPSTFIQKAIHHAQRIGQIVESITTIDLDTQYQVSTLIGPYEYSNGDLYFGQYKDGKKEGIGEMWDINDNYYQGYFNNDRFEGKGRMIDIHSNIYQGNWTDGCMNGYGEMINMHGHKYTGEWFDNMKNGIGEETYSDGSVFKGIHIFGFKQGYAHITFQNTNTFVGQMVQNQLTDGVYTFKYGFYEGPFKDNRFHGKAKLVIQNYQLLLYDVDRLKNLQLKKTDIQQYQKQQRLQQLKQTLQNKAIDLSKQEINKQKQEEIKRIQQDKKLLKQEEKKRKQEEKKRQKEEKKRKQEEKKRQKEEKKLQKKKGLKVEQLQNIEQAIVDIYQNGIQDEQPKQIIIEGVFDNGQLIEYEDKAIMEIVNLSKIGDLYSKVSKLIQNQLVFNINDNQLTPEDIWMNEEFEELNDIQTVKYLGDLKNKLLVQQKRVNNDQEEDLRLQMIIQQKQIGSIWMKDRTDNSLQLLRDLDPKIAKSINIHTIEVDVRNDLSDLLSKSYNYEKHIGLSDIYFSQSNKQPKSMQKSMQFYQKNTILDKTDVNY